MCNTLHRLAATKIPFITVQQGYEFRYDVYVDGQSFLCKVVTTSATFVLTMDALPNHFLYAIEPVSRNRCTKRVVVDAFGDNSPGYFC
ncbi:hypothetical protein TNCV_3349601 [Trichonephila clavipes]|nr:hypothetical protein TNCV_3349601 [Trichonephila clavipes]